MIINLDIFLVLFPITFKVLSVCVGNKNAGKSAPVHGSSPMSATLFGSCWMSQCVIETRFFHITINILWFVFVLRQSRWRRRARTRRVHAARRRTPNSWSWPKCCRSRRPSLHSWTKHPSSAWRHPTSKWDKSSPTVSHYFPLSNSWWDNHRLR